MHETAFLESMVQIASLSGQETELSEWLVYQMQELGLIARRDPVGNAIGIAGNPDAPRTIVLLGHMDTVRGMIPVRQEGDALYGRGTVDAKGPLATLTLAAARVAPQLDHVRIVVIGAVEEEAHGRGAKYIRDTMDAPDCVIIGEPSSWDAITLGYKGCLTVHHRWHSSEAHGASDHQTPAEKAVDFWKHVEAQADLLNEERTGAFHTLTPSLREIHTFSDGIRAWSEMDIALRLPPALAPDTVCGLLGARHPDEQVSFPYSEPAYQSGKNSPLVRSFLRAIRSASGQPRFKLKTGTSDMNVVGPAWGCPIVAYGPGDSNLDHTPHEHIDIPEYLRGIDILTDALSLLSKEFAATREDCVGSVAGAK